MKITVDTLFPRLKKERERALHKIGEMFYDELYTLSSGEMVPSVTGALRSSIFMDVNSSNGSVTVGYDVNRAPHAKKFRYVVESAWDNIQMSPQYREVINTFIRKGFSM